MKRRIYLLILFYFTYNLGGGSVYLLIIGMLLKQYSLASSVSYLRSQIAINDLLEEENVIF